MSYVFGYTRNRWAIATIIIVAMFLFLYNGYNSKPTLAFDGVIVTITLLLMMIIHRAVQ
jgi:uncharacterized membrane protein